MWKYIVASFFIGIISYLSVQMRINKIQGFVNGNNETLLIIGIMSSQNNFDERQSLRDTWLKLVNQKSVKYHFVIGSEICGVPPEDRLYKEACTEWRVGIPEISLFSTGKSQTKKTTQNMYAGFTFLVQHPIVLHSLSVSASFVSIVQTHIKVSLYNPNTGERIVSGTFLNSNNSNSELLIKPVEPYLLPRGFEGQLVAELSERGEIKYILTRAGCWMQWNHASGLITFQQLVLQQFEKPVSFHDEACTPVSMTFSVHDKDELMNHVNERTHRYKMWQSESQLLKRKLQQESQKYEDILFVDTIDVYRNLPRKVLLFFQWAHRNANFTYLLKTDDDTFINLPEVYINLETAKHQQQSYLHWWSSFREGWTVQSFGKWREDSYRSTTYPPFPCGAGYVLSRSLVQFLGCEAYDFLYKDFQGEDVSLGIWLAGLNPMPINNDRNSCTWSCDEKCDSSACNRAELSIKDVHQAWDSFRECKNFCGCQ